MHDFLALKKYFKKYRFPVLLGILALIAIDLLQLFIPRILKIAIDALTSGSISLHGLGYYFFLIMLIALGIAFGRFWWRYLLIGSSRKIERELRTDFYQHLTTLDISYFDIHKTGDLMAHAINDINAVRMALGFGVVILTDIFILGIASLIMMISISPRLTFYSLIFFPLIAFLSTRFGRIIHILFEKVQESFALLTERVRENLSGIRVVKAFVQEDAETHRFEEFSRAYVVKNMNLIKVWGMFFPVIMFLAGIGEVIVLGMGGRYVILGTISIGSFVAFIAYLQMMVWPMIAIGRAINIFQRGAASQGRINRIMSEMPVIASGEDTLDLVGGEIEFRNVSFTFQGKDSPALKDISLRINPKEFVGVTGSIGSGKTSMVNLLLRLYEPETGDILIDGRNIKDYTIASLRNKIAFVPQDVFLFSETIKENILLGKRNASMDEVERVSKLAHIYDEIMQFPGKFDTVIGERGITLSGGQKQRIALARALLLDRPILILDDAFSSVDVETERKILLALKNELKNYTSIVISHRIVAIKEASKIIVLDNGTIAEQGTHAELIKNKGVYWAIFRTQQIEMKLEVL